ncbi:hypothetical protein GPAL_2508 [Glaciecola pallidula DSM 14239 = ACAM 615]|uniref:Uncharacterized protein n=1 Tax=Brumicola pallidula DSM 14239 = ACAM 615 TaxID=1121922 RepID=K7A1I9_9ALTE|nr:hypothetical protein GPAL_2508 [Glaciecola pallidula DSM 14239 = ACAM 615]
MMSQILSCSPLNGCIKIADEYQYIDTLFKDYANQKLLQSNKDVFYVLIII